MNQKRQKRRWTWKEKHLRKQRFSFKGINWKAEWYWCRFDYCLEDHEQRRTFEKQALFKVMTQGYDEEEVYFPTRWRDTIDYFW